MSEDPIGFGGGVNFYTYVQNNPVNLTDPFGMFNKRFVNGLFEKSIRNKAKEHGFVLSKDASREIRKETTLEELDQLRDKKRLEGEKLDILDTIVERVINNEDVKKELRDEIRELKEQISPTTKQETQCQ